MTFTAEQISELKFIVLNDEGFARRVDAELDALGYPLGHFLRVAARSRFTPAGRETVGLPEKGE